MNDFMSLRYITLSFSYRSRIRRNLVSSLPRRRLSQEKRTTILAISTVSSGRGVEDNITEGSAGGI